jgi:hypothetical protein
MFEGKTSLIKNVLGAKSTQSKIISLKDFQLRLRSRGYRAGMTLHIQSFDINDERLLIVGPLYDRLEKLTSLKQICQPNDILVFLGDTCYPYKNTTEVVKRLNELTTFFEGKTSYYLLGEKDLLFKSQIKTAHSDAYDWLHYKLLGVRFIYNNQSSVLMIHGGILPKHRKLSDLNNDPEVSFITETGEEINWHKKYDGRFGYVISSHPASKEAEGAKVGHYKYSSSLDTLCYESGILAVQEFTCKGLGQTFYL